jgi:hypothetical protein
VTTTVDRVLPWRRNSAPPAEEVAPLLNPTGAEKFKRQAAPSHAVITIFSELHMQFPDYTFREASLNPLNLANRADPEEEELFHILAERRRKTEEQHRAILNPKKPWWKIW